MRVWVHLVDAKLKFEKYYMQLIFFTKFTKRDLKY